MDNLRNVDPQDLILELPVICTRGMVIFPDCDLVLDVGRKKSLQAIEEATNHFDKQVLFVSQIDPMTEDPGFDDIYHVGTLCEITKRVKRENEDTVKLTVRGHDRLRIMSLWERDGSLFATCQILKEVEGDKNEEVAYIRELVKSIETLHPQTHKIPADFINDMSKGVSAPHLVDTIANFFPMSLESRQRILETLEVNKRILLIINEIEEEKVINEIENDINKKVRENIDENQREYFLREKLRAIKEELGDTPNKEDDSESLRDKIENNPYPQHVKDKALDELRKLEMMPSSSAETNVVRTYLDWLLKTPWYERTEDQEDLNTVENILNEDHFGLKEVKERILEYLAVKQMTNSLKAPIICLVGPPGVGKTSLAKSIARALDRKFVKASLGGVKDESEVRGHRRTYLGSMPGRIIQSMKKAGVVNPVFLLDEIDKMSSDYKGDPSSAMLEVLDPEQNSFFSDNYLEEPYDLSNVLFIATANTLDTIPGPLRDRLEIIQLSSYTEQEKMNIAKEHLIPKGLNEHGLTDAQFTISDEAILRVIRHHTREAGVRQLERLLFSLCRKAVVKVLKNKESAVNITAENLPDYLGKDRFDHTRGLKEPQIGTVTGLAYTQYGGDILPIEVTHFQGTGKLVITGQLGDVMKESAKIALDYVKSNADKYQIDLSKFEKEDIHIHVPEGAVPKDGPSAGVTMTTALYSIFTNKYIRNDIGMTGEITLRGNVLPIGGLKEKSISAHRSGIKTIIIPKENERDIDEIPDSVKAELNIVLADHIDQVLEAAIAK